LPKEWVAVFIGAAIKKGDFRHPFIDSGTADKFTRKGQAAEIPTRIRPFVPRKEGTIPYRKPWI